MKITAIRVDIVDVGGRNSIFVRVDTDNDLVGLGETVMKRRDQSVAANLREIGDYLVGKDPLAIEDHAEKLYRDSFWVGGPLHAAARSAVDIALWDIKGQYYHAPIYQMLGGPTRSSVALYAHAASGSSPDEFVANLKAVAEAGYVGAKTGLPLFYGIGDTQPKGAAGYFGHSGSVDPSLKETEYFPTAMLDRVGDWFAAAREAVGWEFELMLDCHGRLNLPNAVRLADRLAPFKLLFIEEPLPPESSTEFAVLSRHSTTPIAAGERLISPYDVRPYLESGALAVLQCDVVNCGGFTGAKKIAALADAYYVPFAPHNPNGPIATLAAAHLLSAIPNGYLLETTGNPDDPGRFAEVVDHPPAISAGVLTLSDRPGIGAALHDDASMKWPGVPYRATR